MIRRVRGSIEWFTPTRSAGVAVGELVLDRVDRVGQGVLGLLDLVLHSATGLVELALAFEVLVSADHTSGFFHTTLGLVDLGAHGCFLSSGPHAGRRTLGERL